MAGGHTKVGETFAESLVREYEEETGTEILCNRLLWAEEAFWKWGIENANGVAF